MAEYKPEFSHEWIYKLESQYHWSLYRHQLDLVLNKSKIEKEQSIIEIGVGSGMTSEYLKRKGYQVKTIDIDENKSPDITANIMNYELPRADMYLAFEVLEHIPIEGVISVWKKLANKKVSELAFSIPYGHKTYFWMECWLPYFGNKMINISKKRRKINSKHHHWEIGINGVTLDSIEEMLKECGYEINYSYRYRNHHFFLTHLIK